MLAPTPRLVAFYVTEHHTVVPHAAFQGQTPYEIYFGRGERVPAQLAEARRLARQARLASNRDVSCEHCRTPVTESAASQLLPLQQREPQWSAA
ncbi:MAG: hypothetical protein JW940_33010 [Polyangiaceae bacterium]|nr:hypothetical protein [Polyangiaceae bacterium]